MVSPLAQALGFTQPELTRGDLVAQATRPLTAGERDQLRSLKAQVLAATNDPAKAQRAVQQQAGLFLTNFPSKAPGIIDNTIQDVSELVHGIGTLVGQVVIEGAVDPIGQLIAGDPNAAWNEVLDAGQKAFAVGKLLPGAFLQSIGQSSIGALATGDFELALTRAKQRPFTAALDVSLGLGLTAKGIGALGRAGQTAKVASSLTKFSRAIDPAILIGRGISGFGKLAESSSAASRVISAALGGAIGGIAGGPLGAVAGAGLGSLAPVVGPVSKFLRRQGNIKRWIRDLTPVEFERFGRALDDILRGEGGLNDTIPLLYRLPQTQMDEALRVVEAGLKTPAAASPEVRKAINQHRALWSGTTGKVNRVMDEFRIMSYADQEVRNTGHMLAARARQGVPDPQFPLDRFKVLSEGGGPDLAQFVDDFRRSLPDGVDLTYVSYQATDNAINTSLQWARSLFGAEPKPGFLKASSLRNIQAPEFKLNLARSVEQLRDQTVPLLKIHSRMEAVLADPSVVQIGRLEYQRVVQSVLDDMTRQVQAAGGTTASANQFAQRLSEAITAKFGSLEGKVLFSPDIALGAIRGAQGTLKGLKGGLAKGEDLTRVINRVMKRRVGKEAPLGAFAALNVDEFPRIGIAPAELFEAFQETLPSFGPFADLIDKAIDQPLRFLKRSWLGWSPSWTANTVVGNVLLGAFGGNFDPRNYARALRKEIREAIPGEVSMNQYRNLSPDALVETAEMGRKMGLGKLPNAARLWQGFTGPLFGFTSAVDEFHRRAAYIRQVSGWKPPAVMKDLIAKFGKTTVGHDELLGRLRTLRAIDADSLVRAGVARSKAPGVLKDIISSRRKFVGEVTKFFGDYNTLTRFERSFVKRIVPFYEWWRHMATLGLSAPVTMPGRTKFLQVLTNVVRDAEDDELMAEFGLDRSQLATFFEASTSAKRLQEVMSKVGESEHGLQILGALAGTLFGGGIAGVPGAVAGAAVGAGLGGLAPKAAFTSHPERELTPLLMTTSLNPFETSLDVAQSALAWLGMGTIDPDLKAGVISGALAPQLTIPVEAIFGINLFTGKKFRKITEGGVTVEVGEEGLLADPTAPNGFRRVRYGGVWDVLFTRFIDSLPQLKHLQRLTTPFLESGSRVTGPDELLGVLSDVLQGRTTERAKRALRDPITREPIPASRYVNALRMFGVNLKEVDVARRRVVDVRWTRRKLGETFNAWMRTNPRAAEVLATTPNLVQPLAVKWLRREARKKARTGREAALIDARVRQLQVEAR